MTEKWLGKITKCELGKGGYQDSSFGFIFTIEGSYGISDFWVAGHGLTGEVLERVAKLLKDAKKNNLSELVGTPVEVTTENGVIKSWRVLTEVI